jgi:hypothetical protein
VRAAIARAETSAPAAPIASASPEWFLAGLVSAALADGKIDPEEQTMLDRACAALKLPPETVAAQLASFRERMQREASRPRQG